jgi:hypothetical protein
MFQIWRTWFRARVEITRLSVDREGVGIFRGNTGGEALILDVNDISIPPLSCNHNSTT